MQFHILIHTYTQNVASFDPNRSKLSINVECWAMRKTLLHQLRRRYDCNEAHATVRLATEDVTPLLASSVTAARALAEQEDHANKSNLPGALKRFLKTALPVTFSGRSFTGGSFAVPPAWRPFIDAVPVRYPVPHIAVVQRTRIATLAKVLFAAGITTPAALPDRATVESLLRRAGHDAGIVKSTVIAYRSLHRHLLATGAVVDAVHMPSRSRPNEIGLRSLPASLFGALGGLPAMTAPSDLTAEALLPHICPLLASALADWERLFGAKFRPRSLQTAMYGVAQVVAEIARNPDLLARCEWPEGAYAGQPIPTLPELDLWHLLELQHPTSSPASARADSDSARRLNGGQPLPTRRTSLLFAAIEQYAGGLRSRATVQGLPYPGWAETVYQYVATVARGLYEEAMAGRASWTRMKSALTLEAKEMDEANEGVEVTGEKDKLFLVEQIPLPLLVCVVLPRMAARVREREAALRTLEATLLKRPAGGYRQRKVRRARRDYLAALEQYVVLAVFVADPVRASNVKHGWVGCDDEFRLTVRAGADGQPCVAKVTSRFVNQGTRNRKAWLKQRGSKITRQWTWSPLVIDHGLLLDFLIKVRWPRIVRGGLLREADGSPVAMNSGLMWDELLTGRKLPLFVSPEPRANDATFPALPILFGRALHGALQDILSRDMPPLQGRGQTRWRSLLSPHVVRLMWGSYWAGVRGHHGPVVPGGHTVSGLTIAMHATTDTEKVLLRDYTVVADWALDAERSPSVAAPGDTAAAAELWRHPRAYDRWMDATYCHQGTPVRWETEVVPLPPGVTPMSAPVAAPSRRRKGGAKAKRH